MATSLYPFLSNRDKISETCGNMMMMIIVVVLREMKYVSLIRNTNRDKTKESKSVMG
jgi:hypothetical protein